jgi:hypothetical protein
MTSLTEASALQESSAFRPILWAGLICGVLDISAACTTWAFRGIRPFRVLQGIAAGLLGPRSFQGGSATAALGATIRFLIAFTVSAMYYAASRKFLFMTQQAVVSGLLYGVLVYLFMNWIVLPLSAATKRPVTLSFIFTSVIVHMFCVGLLIALTIRRFAH